MRTRHFILLCLAACTSTPSKTPTTGDSAPVDSGNSGESDACTTALQARAEATGGVLVSPTDSWAACTDAEDDGYTYVDVAAEWGFTPDAPTNTEHLRGGVAAVEDFDKDGWLDILFGYKGAPLMYFRGSPTGFSATSLPETSGEGPVALADIDGDGDIDAISAGPPGFILWNEGGTFRSTFFNHGSLTVPVVISPADFDGDGYIDLHLTCSGSHSDGPSARADTVSLGDGTGAFVPTELPLPDGGGQGFDSVVIDIDLDGDLDVYTVNDFGTELGPNVLWENEGGTFTSRNIDCACDLAISGMGADAADINGDGLPELLVASTGANHLLSPDENGKYTDIAQSIGADPLTGLPTMAWGNVAVDVDDDGRMDIVVAEGDFWLESTDPALRDAYDAPLHLLMNRGNPTSPQFVNEATARGLSALGSWRAIVPADFDNDGKIDLLITDIVGPPKLFRAEGCTRNGAFEVEGPPGSRVEACVGGQRQVHAITHESGWGGAKPARARFGLGPEPVPDKIWIWRP